MSVLGKTAILICDQCGEPLREEHTVIIDPRDPGSKRRFHPACYWDEQFTVLCRPEIEKAIRDGIKEELKNLWKKVCPACTHRLRSFIENLGG